MRFLVFILLIAGLGLAQVSLASRVGFFGVIPDYFTALTVISAVSLNPWQAAFSGLLAGIFKDSFDVLPFGMNTFLLPLLAFSFSKLNRKLSLENSLLCAILGGIGVFVYTLCAGFVLVYSGKPVPSGALAGAGLLSALLTGLVIYPMSRFIKPPSL